MSPRTASILLTLLLTLGGGFSAFGLAPEEVLVIANGRQTSSVALAQFYMVARGIPSNQLVLLDLPTGEIISRGLYETQIRDPLMAILRSNDWIQQVSAADADSASHAGRTTSSSLRALVPIRGVPLHIAPSRPFAEPLSRLRGGALMTDQAAVDSELSLILAGPYPLKGRVPNPHYTMVDWPEMEDDSTRILMVSRLDGPDDETVRRMMKDAIEVERVGLRGRAYFDLRVPRNDAYASGDDFLGGAAQAFQHAGIECVVDQNDGIFGTAYPMDEAMWYAGWYAEQVSGPFQRKDFRFRRGAIAYHLHSTSAKSLRSPEQYWAAPLLAAGACATLGCTAEPLLQLTPNLEILSERLLAGHSFGESAYLSLPALSWQITVIGDPLYTPFRAQRDDDPGASPWVLVERVNRWVREGAYNRAVAALREGVRSRPDPILWEKLGDLYARGDLPLESYSAFAAGAEQADQPVPAIRLLVKAGAAARACAQSARYVELQARILERWKGHPCATLVEEARP